MNRTSAAMKTDRYELTMLSSFIEDGSVDRHAVFEAFSRRLPAGRRYGVVAGLGRLVPMIEAFRFTPEEVTWLAEVGAITTKTASYLNGFRFTGTIRAYPEGELYFPGSPIVQVEGTLGECVVLETLILSVLNHDSAIASAAARMVVAASGRPLIEMGSRRAHDDAAIAVARAAYLTGFASTSNLAAGFTYGIPTVGTAAHAFTLAHKSEVAAFTSQVAAHGPGTTLLVDTYDIPTGIRNAVAVAGPGLGAIRIDSGDLDVEARKARVLLDGLGNRSTRITVTSDLDEYVLEALKDAPIDGYGVGTRVATGSGHPTAGFVYKLVAIADEAGAAARLRPVAKKASGKVSVGGRKTAYRTYAGGTITSEVFTVGDVPAPAGAVPVQQVVVAAGVPAMLPTLTETRAWHERARAQLPISALSVTDGDPAFSATLYAPAVTRSPLLERTL
ncbi:MAG: nicotinate phosphoribosyltransferase [Propionicimonas sp.]